MTLSADVRFKVSAVFTGQNDLNNPEFRPVLEFFKSFSDGTGEDEANLVWTDERTLAASTSESLDFAGILTDVYGAVITAAELVLLAVIADADNTNNVVIGDAASPIPLLGGTNPTLPVKPGGAVLLIGPNSAGLANVSGGGNDLLKVANSGAGSSVTYKILVLARNA